MKVIINKNRVVTKSVSKSGTINENKYEILQFVFPEGLEDYTKYIEFETEEGKYVDTIENDEYKVTRSITQYNSVKAQVVCKDLPNDIVFKSDIFDLTFNNSINASEELPEKEKDLLDEIELELQQAQEDIAEMQDDITNIEGTLNQQSQAIGTNTANISTLQGQVSTTEQDISNIKTEQTTQNTNISTNAQDIANIKAEQITQNNNISTNTANIQSNSSAITLLQSEAGNKVTLDINSNYLMTLRLLNKANQVISTATLDFPIESMVVNASYSNGVLTLTLQNGNILDVDISDIIDGLVNETTFNQAVARLDGLITGLTTRMTTVEGEIDDIQAEQTEQNTNIQTNADDIEILQNKVDLLESIIPTGEASGESITLTDSARYPFKEFNVGGNTKQATAILPDEYQQVDYIESSGTQYIRTGFYTSNDMKITGKFSISSAGWLFGTNTDGQTEANVILGRIYTSSTASDIRLGINYENRINITGDADVHTFEMSGINNGRLLRIDNTTGTPGNLDASIEIVLFASNSNDTLQAFSSAKIYELKMYNSTTLVRDFIPCYRKADNVVGLYDLVNKTFYTNAGTGAFTYGAIVSIPNPSYPQEIENVSGEVEVKVENGTDSTAQGYEEQTAILHLPEGMEMCKSYLGEYTDDFIKQGDKWYKYKQNMKRRLLASNIQSIGGLDSTKGYIQLIGITDKLNGTNVWCNYLTNVALQGAEDNSNKIGIANINTDGAFRIRYKTGELTLAGANEFLTNNEVIIQYRLKTPVLEEITDPTLISDLESLKNLYSYKGTTYISSTNEPSPVFEVVYRKSLG